MNAAYWAWVGNSAFRGIREPRDFGLGAQCVILAAAPFVVGTAAFWRTGKMGSTAGDPQSLGRLP